MGGQADMAKWILVLLAIAAIAVATPIKENEDNWAEADDNAQIGYGKPSHSVSHTHAAGHTAIATAGEIAAACVMQASVVYHTKAKKEQAKQRRLLGKAKESMQKKAVVAKAEITKLAGCCKEALACRGAAKKEVCNTKLAQFGRRLLGSHATSCEGALKGHSVSGALALVEKEKTSKDFDTAKKAAVIAKLKEIKTKMVACLKAKDASCSTTQAWSAPYGHNIALEETE